jgi:serine/threonine protein kinase
MATGRPAFSGNTSGVITDGILNRVPVPLAHLNPEIPPKLEEIISKAIEKDRKLRYQHASDIRADLHRLKRDTESGRSAAGPGLPRKRWFFFKKSFFRFWNKFLYTLSPVRLDKQV